MQRITVIVVSLCALFLPLHAFAECRPRDFMINDVVNWKLDIKKEIAFLLTATEDEFNKAKKELGGGYDMITGEFQDARENARRLATTVKFDSSYAYDASFFSQTLSEAGINAYEDCLLKDPNRPQFEIWFQERDDDVFYFRAVWVGDDITIPTAKLAEPLKVINGKAVDVPKKWIKSQPQPFVVQRSENKTMTLILKVGEKSAAFTIVKDPPDVHILTQTITADKPLPVESTYSNPCSAGSAMQCINTRNQGGFFVPHTEKFVGVTNNKGYYHEDYSVTPTKICVTVTQGTGACENRGIAHGVLTATEEYPVTDDAKFSCAADR